MCEVRPAMQFEQLIETMFGLAADGKTNRKGMPNPLHLAVIAKHHFDDASSLPACMDAADRLALGALWAGCSATRRRTCPPRPRLRSRRRSRRMATVRTQKLKWGLFWTALLLALLLLAVGGMIVRAAAAALPSRRAPARGRPRSRRRPRARRSGGRGFPGRGHLPSAPGSRAPSVSRRGSLRS